MNLEENFSVNIPLFEHKTSKAKGPKEYYCTEFECGKLLKTRKAYEDHMRIHNGDRPFRCHYPGCGKDFTQYSSLQKHERIHKGEKLYKCGQCGQAFTQISNLKRHERLHTGEKPYVCEVCEKSFSTVSNLKQHQQVHEEEVSRPKFICERCGKGYFYQSSLSKHHKSHQKKDAKAALKQAKLAAKKHGRTKNVLTETVIVKSTNNHPCETSSEAEILMPAPRKQVKKEPQPRNTIQTNQDNSNFTANYVNSENQQIEEKKAENESANDFVFRFSSFEFNIADAGVRKKRIPSFLEFVENINAPVSNDTAAGGAVGGFIENPNYQSSRRFGTEEITGGGRERASSNILSFLEGDFFGEAVKPKPQIQPQQTHSRLPSFLEGFEGEMRRFSGMGATEILGNENKEEPRFAEPRESILRNSLDFFFDMTIPRSRRNSSFLFSKEEF